MPELGIVHDQMGREVRLAYPSKRIVSLVPSQTEFFLDIGANVVGRTKFCIHPAKQVANIPIVGGTKKFRFDVIRSLNPDLIIGNKEENYKEGIEVLAEEFPVWMSDIYTLEDSFSMMRSLGTLCGAEPASSQIISDCKLALEQVKGSKAGRALYLIWKNPWMAAGKGTFIDHMLGYLGFENVVSGERYPRLTDKQIFDLQPDVILFSSEPFPFKSTHLQEAQNAWPNSTCELVDGELYSWYGSRLKHWS